MQKTLSQKRAAKAAEYVAAIRDTRQRDKLKQLPGLIAVNGLLPALLHLEKEEKESALNPIAGHLCEWLGADVNKAILVAASAADYRRYTQEALAYATWLKRWAQAEGE